MGVLICGNLLNMVLFGLLVLLVWGLQKWTRKVPKLAYKFVDSFGIALILDFVLIFLVDLIKLVTVMCDLELGRRSL